MTTTKAAMMGLPIRVRLPCERCGTLHIDRGEFATKRHHTHQCEKCGLVWRPAEEDTIGVQFLYDQAKPTPLPSTLMERATDVLRAQYEYQWFSFEPYPPMYKDLINAKFVPVELDPLKQIRGYFERTAKVDYANGTLSVAFWSKKDGTCEEVNKALMLFGRPKDLATIQISWSES